MKRVIELTLPKVFIAENVKGLISLANVKDIDVDFLCVHTYRYVPSLYCLLVLWYVGN